MLNFHPFSTTSYPRFPHFFRLFSPTIPNPPTKPNLFVSSIFFFPPETLPLKFSSFHVVLWVFQCFPMCPFPKDHFLAERAQHNQLNLLIFFVSITRLPTNNSQDLPALSPLQLSLTGFPLPSHNSSIGSTLNLIFRNTMVLISFPVPLVG